MSESIETGDVREQSGEPPVVALVPDVAGVQATAELPPEARVVPLPGSVLRAAREARNLSVFDVAQFLKFSPRQIEALEADEYALLPPGPTFLRGFVRGYAKLLKLDVMPLLAMLEARLPAAFPDVRAPQNMGVAESPVVASRRTSKPMLVGAALLAVLVLGLGAWHYLGPLTLAARAPAATPAGEAVVRPPEIRIEETPETLAPGQAAAVVNPADTHQIVFVFGDKAWVEVTDATHRIVFSGENEAGTRQAVVGKPPFQLVVGNAAKVEVQYDDHQVDLKPYTRAEVARLTLE